MKKPKVKTYVCSWCARDCDGSIQAVRESRLTYINDTTRLEGVPQFQSLAFCTESERDEYYFGM